MRKLSLRCSGSSPSHCTTSSTASLPTTPPPPVLTPPPSGSTLTPPPNASRRLVASRSLGSTASPPSTPPVTHYSIPPCLPSHQHHAKLPVTPGPPSHRSLPALHHHPLYPATHISEDSHHHHHSSHPTLHTPIISCHSSTEPHALHGSHPSLHPHSPSSMHTHSLHASPPTSRPIHFSHASVLGRGDHQHPRQLPGLPRHHTIGGVGSGRLLPPAPSSSVSTCASQEVPVCSASTTILSRTLANLSSPPLAARPAYALQSSSYKHSLDVPRTNLRDLRSNTFPPPGPDTPPSKSSSGTTSSATPSENSGPSENSPIEIVPPSSPRLSPGMSVIGRLSPFVIIPSSSLHSSGRRSSLSSSMSSSCATSPVPRVSPVPPLRSPGHSHTSPSLSRSSPLPLVRSSPTPASGIASSPTTPLSRKNSMEPPISPLLRKTSRPPLMRSHAMAG
ncbi:UNVERIFIED_CONTAM: hypothetical protein RMT77_002991 [Armadillidium vulgare]